MYVLNWVSGKFHFLLYQTNRELPGNIFPLSFVKQNIEKERQASVKTTIAYFIIRENEIPW